MGQYLSNIQEDHNRVTKVGSRQHLNSVHCSQVVTLCTRWKALGIPFYMTVNEFTKNIVADDEVYLNFDKYVSSGLEIETLEFLTALLITSTGPMEQKLDSKF